MSGTNGTNGATGQTGSQGNTGMSGTNGTNGATGQTGTNGSTGATGGPGTAYDLSMEFVGKPITSQVILRVKAARAWAMPATIHQGVSGVAATASTTFTVAKNGTSIGTFVFAASGTVPTFSITATNFAVGDILTMTAPATVDSTLADISITMLGSLL